MARSVLLKQADKTPLQLAFFATSKDALLAKVLHNYFSAIRDAFPNEWSENPKKYLLRKTAGYVALLMVFKWDWETRASKSKDASYEAYLELGKRLRVNSLEKEITSANFGSSEGGAKELAKFMWG